jgi:hypothetical protein
MCGVVAKKWHVRITLYQQYHARYLSRAAIIA